MMLTRQEFADYFNSIKPGLGDANSPLWLPDSNEFKTQWFMCVKPIGVRKFKFSYYDWCNNTLVGKVRCYSSGEDEEWWGFTEQKDIVLWTLKWT